MLATLLVAAPARAIIRLPAAPTQVAHNPADASSRSRSRTPSTTPPRAAASARSPAWPRSSAGSRPTSAASSRGTYRCEKWGKKQASLHSEGRAIDWHLDATKAADRREAERLARLLLAPDSLGNPQALARRWASRR